MFSIIVLKERHNVWRPVCNLYIPNGSEGNPLSITSKYVLVSLGYLQTLSLLSHKIGSDFSLGKKNLRLQKNPSVLFIGASERPSY